MDGAESQPLGAGPAACPEPGSVNVRGPAEPAQPAGGPARARTRPSSGTGLSCPARLFITPALWCFSFICVEIELHGVPNVPAARAAEVGDLRGHEIIDTWSAARAGAVSAQLTTSPLL